MSEKEFMGLLLRCVLCIVLVSAVVYGTNVWQADQASTDVINSMKQFDTNNRDELITSHRFRNAVVVTVWGVVALTVLVVLSGDIGRCWKKVNTSQV